MRGSRVPGGTTLVLGSSGQKYRRIYPELDRRARAAHLTVLANFDDPLQAGHRSEERDAICTMTRASWNALVGRRRCLGMERTESVPGCRAARPGLVARRPGSRHRCRP